MKVMRLVNGIPRTYTIGGEETISNGATNKVVTFAASSGSSSPKVGAWIFNSTDANPQYIPVTITARSATGFTASWNTATNSADYKLIYMILDGFIA